MTDTTSDRNYFDLHILGIGYLHRVREITPKRGEPFLAVEVSALHGAAGQVEYTRFDCKVSGREAQRIVRQLQPDIETERRVLVGFKLSDLYAETFTYQKALFIGKLAGQVGLERTVERALLARRMLLTGMRDPHVSATPAPRQLEPFMAELEREIDNLVFETRVRREIASRTADLLLRDEHRERAASQGLVPRQDPHPADEGGVRP